MSFDNSRFPFNPWNDYLGVVMQQGRVQLDSDWNEWQAEFARRIQAGSLDIIGRSGVPSTTPFAFQISQPSKDSSGAWHVTIGVGRIYVDGLLAQNHGSTGLVQWDSALAEWVGAPQTPTDYTSQPYLPEPVALPTPPTGPTLILVYLDVWQRDVSYIEDPNLVDQAVGIDTTGRRQTVWQVKFLDVSNVAGGVTPATPDSAISSWESVILPSPSLLTNGVVPSASSGPCALSPATGYTGLENQLYRVEIHQAGIAASGATTPVTEPLPAGPPPTATFKWSRENASVATAVTLIASATNSLGATASQLTVQSLGRDQVLGFNPGDWIEVIDDYLELNGEPGELHQIDSINASALTITLDTVVSATNFPINSSGQPDPTRHTRILRWDQDGSVYESDGATVWVNLDASGTTGDIPVPPVGTPLILENGITVAFDLGSSGNWNATTTYTPGQVVLGPDQNYYTSIAANNLGNAPPTAPAFWTIAQFRTGDYWTFAARTADSLVEPLIEAPPSGIHHHYCRLGIVSFTGTPATTDCRQVFPALANPSIQVTGVVLGNGSPFASDGTVSVQDLASGINIACNAPIDPTILTQSQPAVQTSAAYAWNAATAYTPGQVVTNGGIYYICTADSTGQAPPNPAFWAIAQFNCPICFVTADLASTTPPGAGFNPFILSSTVSVTTNTINWLPSSAATAALETQVSPGAAPTLAHLKLKGNSIWALGNPQVFLNGAGDGRVSADYDMWFWLISQPVVTLSGLTGNTLSFPNQALGTTSAALSVTLTNNSSTDPVNFTSPIAVSGTNAADFALTNLCGTTLGAGASCALNITFTPSVAGPETAQISIAESADANPLLILLTGTCVAAQVTASTASLSFNVQVVNTTSAPQIVTLTNTGTAPLTVSSVTLSGDSDFSQSSTCIPPGGSGTLGPSQQCQISVQFTPSAVGARTATLSINTNGGNPTIALTGTGTNPVKVKDIVDIPKVTRDVVKTGDSVKSVVRETIVTTRLSSAEDAPAAGSEDATRRAFISPEERPSVEPPKTEPKGE
jgi:Family of unknown function (DUF6519)/Abnormal spindle-like microcephaly-assoc'd, ASPM-SPD-2-Hydin